MFRSPQTKCNKVDTEDQALYTVFDIRRTDSRAAMSNNVNTNTQTQENRSTLQEVSVIHLVMGTRKHEINSTIKLGFDYMK